MRILLLFIGLALLAGCTQTGSEPTQATTTDPEEILNEVIDNMQDVNNFKMILEQAGKEYPFSISLDGGQTAIEAILRRADAQFVAPDTLYADVGLRVAGLPLSINIFGRGDDQWIQPTTVWINFPFAEGFDPGELLAEDGGFRRALQRLDSLEYIGEETLDVGTPVHHIKGTAEGEVVEELLFGLLALEDDVIVDVFVDRETLLPALLIMTQTETATEDEEPTEWHLELYDINGDIELDDPTAQESG